MESFTAKPMIERTATAALLAFICLLSLAVAFFTQASALNYSTLLQSVLLAGCLPQVVGLGILALGSSREILCVGSAIVLISWFSVIELTIRVLAA